MGKGNENLQINDLIFKEMIKRGYSLEGEKKIWNIADSKLWYLTPEQSQAYLDLENSEEYLKAANDLIGQNLILSRAQEILDWADNEPINIIDLGCGDGKKALALIKLLNKKIKIRYCPIDISSYMVKKAIETFSHEEGAADVAEFKYNISDFENLENIIPLLKFKGYKKNLILLLGNTLGNFEINELLYKIRGSMNDNDLLLIDIAVADEKVEERAMAYAKNKQVNDFLIKIPEQLGLLKKDVENNARFKNSRVEYYYTIKNSKTIHLYGKEIVFNVGDQIIVAIGYKHDEKDLLAYLNLYFDSVDANFSDDRAQVSTLCKK